MNFGKMESALQKKGTDKIQVHKFSNLGTRINQITTKNLNGFKFKFPARPEQIKIANFLTTLDEKITQSQTYLETVKQYKQGLLQQMFI